MPSITVRVNPESLKFLKYNKKKPLSDAQQAFMESVEGTYKELSNLKKQKSFAFTNKNEFELLRGDFYAITNTLLTKKVSLEHLQAELETELHINNKETLSFITLCLVEPVWLPGALSAIACSVLSSTSYFCSNQTKPDQTESDSFSCLKAMVGADKKHTIFQLKLRINAKEEALRRGTATIAFTIDDMHHVKFLPIQMQTSFPDKEEAQHFQKELDDAFGSWLLYENELTKIKTKLHKTSSISIDLCVIPILLSLLISLIAMLSLSALSLTPAITPLLLPALGLALGLMLSSLANSYLYLGRKKEEKKLQRPIHIFDRKSAADSSKIIETTSFFSRPSVISGPSTMTKPQHHVPIYTS